MCVKCCLDGELPDRRKGNLRYKFRIPLPHERGTPSLSVALQWLETERGGVFFVCKNNLCKSERFSAVKSRRENALARDQKAKYTGRGFHRRSPYFSADIILIFKYFSAEMKRTNNRVHAPFFFQHNRRPHLLTRGAHARSCQPVAFCAASKAQIMDAFHKSGTFPQQFVIALVESAVYRARNCIDVFC